MEPTITSLDERVTALETGRQQLRSDLEHAIDSRLLSIDRRVADHQMSIQSQLSTMAGRLDAILELLRQQLDSRTPPRARAARRRGKEGKQ